MGPNGNNDQWTYYSVETNTGSDTKISIGYKLGSSGGGTSFVGWDTFRIEYSEGYGMAPSSHSDYSGRVQPPVLPGTSGS